MIFSHRTLYASGNLGKSLLSSFVDIYALFIMTESLGIPLGSASIILMISLIWDAVADPLLGLSIDRIKHRFPSIVFYFYVGVPITALAFIAFFSMEPILSIDARLPLILAVSLLFRTGYTVVDVPHNTMFAYITFDRKERNSVASLRIFFSSLGKFIVTLIGMILLGGSLDREATSLLQPIAISLGIAFSLIMFCSVWPIKNTLIYQSSGQKHGFRIGVFVKQVMGCRPLLIVFLLTAINSLFMPVVSIVVLYYGKYGLLDEAKGATAVSVIAIAQAASLYFWNRFSNQWCSKVFPSQVAYCLLAVGVLTGLFSSSGYLELLVTALVVGVAFAGISMLNWSMLPDALDVLRSESEFNQEFSVFSLYTLSNKIFNGLSSAFIGIVFVSYNFIANMPTTTESIGSIYNTVLLLPLIGSVLCLLLVSWLKAYEI